MEMSIKGTKENEHLSNPSNPSVLEETRGRSNGNAKPKHSSKISAHFSTNQTVPSPLKRLFISSQALHHATNKHSLAWNVSWLRAGVSARLPEVENLVNEFVSLLILNIAPLVLLYEV